MSCVVINYWLTVCQSCHLLETPAAILLRSRDHHMTVVDIRKSLCERGVCSSMLPSLFCLESIHQYLSSLIDIRQNLTVSLSASTRPQYGGLWELDQSGPPPSCTRSWCVFLLSGKLRLFFSLLHFLLLFFLGPPSCHHRSQAPTICQACLWLSMPGVGLGRRPARPIYEQKARSEQSSRIVQGD